MIGAVHNQPQMAQPRFLEGASENRSKVTAIVLSILASLASFVFLPVEGALLVSSALAGLVSLFCCCPRGGGQEGERARWYHYLFSPVPRFFQPNAIPLVNVGPRAQVAPAVYQGMPVANDGPRVRVGGGHAPAGGIHPAMHQEFGAHHVAHRGGHGDHHVPVGSRR